MYSPRKRPIYTERDLNRPKNQNIESPDLCVNKKQQKFQGTTTNQHFYKPYQVLTSPSRRRKEVSKSISPSRKNDEHIMKTTYGVSYSPHKIQNTTRVTRSPQSRAQRNKYSPSPFKLETQTEYKGKYIEKVIEERPSTKNSFRNYKPAYQPSPFKLEQSTTYNAHYSPVKPEHLAQLIQSPSRNSSSPRVSPRRNIPFQATTTNKHDFPHPKLQNSPIRKELYSPSKPISRKIAYSPSHIKFEGESFYKSDYIPKLFIGK